MFGWLVSVKMWGWRWKSTFWCGFVPGFVSICSIRTTEWAREISPTKKNKFFFGCSVFVFSQSMTFKQTQDTNSCTEITTPCSCRSAQWGADLQLFLIAKKRLKPLRAKGACGMLRSWSLSHWGGRFGFLDQIWGTLRNHPEVILGSENVGGFLK